MRRKVPGHHRSFARSMRKEPTEAEAALWAMLRGRKLEGLRFRRQHPTVGYIVDFICLEAKLVVEADGEHHAENDADRVRDEKLRALSYRVLRYWNREILDEPDAVIADILFHSGR